MNSYTLTIFVLIYLLSFGERFFSKTPELRNNVGQKYVCENSKSENKDGPTIEQGSFRTSYDKAYKDLETRIMDIKKQCGKLCETDLPVSKLVTKGRYYDHLKVETNCHGLWNTSIFDEPSKFQHATQTLPSYIKKEFSYKNQVPIHSYYFDNRVEEERDRDNFNWEFGDLVRTKKAPMFDALLTFSSLEHSGLGRYGDQLNPWGDVIAMGRAWCQMKSGARALIGVPTGRDTVCFNSHRIYGPFLYTYLFTNWKQIYSMVDKRIFEMKIYCKTSALYHPIHILEK